MGAKNELWIGKRRSVRSFVTRAGREGKVTAREMLPRFLMSSSSSSSVASSGMRDKYVPARSLINGICLARCAFSPSLALASPTPFCCRGHAKTSPRGTEMGSSWQKCSSGFFLRFRYSGMGRMTAAPATSSVLRAKSDESAGFKIVPGR